MKTFTCLLFAAALTGCGSYMNLGCFQVPYGGVRIDCGLIEMASENDSLLLFFPLLDLPMSLAVDTATLPVTLSFAAVRAAKDDEKKK